jgi:hypothetical protein
MGEADQGNGDRDGAHRRLLATDPECTVGAGIRTAAAGESPTASERGGDGGIVTSSLNVTQIFGYDPVNRLTSAVDTEARVRNGAIIYSYHQWGTRAVTGNYIPNMYATPSGLKQYQK